MRRQRYISPNSTLKFCLHVVCWLLALPSTRTYADCCCRYRCRRSALSADTEHRDRVCKFTPNQLKHFQWALELLPLSSLITMEYAHTHTHTHARTPILTSLIVSHYHFGGLVATHKSVFAKYTHRTHQQIQQRRGNRNRMHEKHVRRICFASRRDETYATPNRAHRCGIGYGQHRQTVRKIEMFLCA